MLEQSRAKHDALVTQAQGQKQSPCPAYTFVDDLGKNALPLSTPGPTAIEHPGYVSQKPLMPRPPDQPSYKRMTSAHRHSR